MVLIDRPHLMTLKNKRMAVRPDIAAVREDAFFKNPMVQYNRAAAVPVGLTEPSSRCGWAACEPKFAVQDTLAPVAPPDCLPLEWCCGRSRLTPGEFRARGRLAGHDPYNQCHCHTTIGGVSPISCVNDLSLH